MVGRAVASAEERLVREQLPRYSITRVTKLNARPAMINQTRSDQLKCAKRARKGMCKGLTTLPLFFAASRDQVQTPRISARISAFEHADESEKAAANTKREYGLLRRGPFEQTPSEEADALYTETKSGAISAPSILWMKYQVDSGKLWRKALFRVSLTSLFLAALT